MRDHAVSSADYFVYLYAPMPDFMEVVLIFLIIGLFCALLFVNVYFRLKVIKDYRILVKNRVEFGARHIFDRQKMEEEIFPRYPEHHNHLISFSKHLRYSIKMASILIVLITMFGAVLMYFR